MSLKPGLLLLLPLLFLSLLSHASSADDHAFTVHFASGEKNRMGGNVMLKVGNVEGSQIDSFLLDFDKENGGTALPKAKQTIEVVVIVPKGASQKKRREMVAQIMSAMSKRYPQIKLTVQESFVDAQEDREVMEGHLAEIQIQKEKTPDGTVAEDILDKALEQAEQGIRENEEFVRNWSDDPKPNPRWYTGRHPYTRVVLAQMVALGKFGISSTVLATRFGFPPWSITQAALGLVRGWSAAGIAGLNGFVGAFFGYYGASYDAWCSTHVFPFFRSHPLVKLYNGLPELKSASINLFRSLGITYIIRTAAWLSGQIEHKINLNWNPFGIDLIPGDLTASPYSLSFFFAALLIAAPEVVLDGFFGAGGRALQVKGYTSFNTRSMLFWVCSYVDAFMHTMLRANQVSAAFYALAVGTTNKFVVWAAGRFLPNKHPRFVFISDEIGTKPVAPKTNLGVVGNFTRWLFLDTFIQMVNAKRGQFNLADVAMVEENCGLRESWNLKLTPADRRRYERDPSLTLNEFANLLHLNDTDHSQVSFLWEVRAINLLSGNTPLTKPEYDRLVATATGSAAPTAYEEAFLTRRLRVREAFAGSENSWLEAMPEDVQRMLLEPGTKPDDLMKAVSPHLESIGLIYREVLIHRYRLLVGSDIPLSLGEIQALSKAAFTDPRGEEGKQSQAIFAAREARLAEQRAAALHALVHSCAHALTLHDK